MIGLIINEKISVSNKEKAEKNIVAEIKKHYNTFVTTTKRTALYKKVEGEFAEWGEINKDIKLKLDNIEITKDTKYFYLKEYNLYIEYNKVIPTSEYIKTDRYNNYIPFNKNVKTKDKVTFYDYNDNFLFTINNQYDFPIIINDNERYGVVFNDELFYIKQNDIEEIYDNKNTDATNKTKIRTLTYHFIYNQEINECDQAICQSFEMFESHLKYIRENDYFTLTLNELEMYLDGKLQIPEKSIVITIDDGTTLDEGTTNLLEKYQVNATLFLITGWFNDLSKFQSPYLDIESHTNDMHTVNECPGYGMQGGGILCLPEEYVLEDLKASQEKLNGSKYFAYPFFDYNDRAIKLLKKAGFNMAFIGQYNTDGYSYPLVTDKYKVRRKTIFSDTSMAEFISYLK